jgi:hypothetical protein
MIFNCPWDTSVIFTTSISFVIILAVAIALFVKMMHYKKAKKSLTAAFCLLGALFFICIEIISATFCPRSISIENEAIYIHRIKGDVVIPLETIEVIRRGNDLDTKNAKRVFGSGGAWGYLGKFRSAQLGDYQMYVTDSSQKILVKTTAGTLIFSCDKPDEFVNCILAKR